MAVAPPNDDTALTYASSVVSGANLMQNENRGRLFTNFAAIEIVKMN